MCNDERNCGDKCATGITLIQRWVGSSGNSKVAVSEETDVWTFQKEKEKRREKRGKRVEKQK